VSEAQPYTPREALERLGRPTGPRTVAGKAKASKNATRHGLLSAEVRLPSESKALFDGFAQRMHDALAPVGELEAILADRAISCAWRLRRVMVIERATLHDERQTEHEGSDSAALALAFVRGRDRLAILSRYEAALERSMGRALHDLERLQARRAGEVVPLPAVLDVDVRTETL
jgi:hypothetical protein